MFYYVYLELFASYSLSPLSLKWVYNRMRYTLRPPFVLPWLGGGSTGQLYMVTVYLPSPPALLLSAGTGVVIYNPRHSPPILLTCCYTFPLSFRGSKDGRRVVPDRHGFVWVYLGGGGSFTPVQRLYHSSPQNKYNFYYFGLIFTWKKEESGNNIKETQL